MTAKPRFQSLLGESPVCPGCFALFTGQVASEQLIDICQRQGIEPGQITVHSDNGSPMKGETMLVTMRRLGVTQSHGRPAVSNDNRHSESLFGTLKYRAQLPLKPFKVRSHKLSEKQLDL